MKAIYTNIDGKYYKINQATGVPSSCIHKSYGVSSTLQTDPINKTVTQFVSINTLENPDTKTNGQLYKEFIEYLENETITEIDTIQDCYKVYIDYSMYRDGKEIEHAQVIRPIESKEKSLLLGVALNNECVYRRVKSFNPKIDFKLQNPLPFGIINNAIGNYVLKINNIAIFQSLNEFTEVHNSSYQVGYNYPSSVINSGLDDSIMIYSSYNAGIEIQEIQLKFVPRHVVVSLDIIFTNYVVVYDDTDIESILIENINKKYEEQKPDDSDNSDGTSDENPPIEGDDEASLPNEDNKPVADGNYEPDEDGYFNYYEKCTEGTPDALLVVEDLMPDVSYDVKTMIRKNMVIADIEDIEVGDYVILRESIIS